VICQLLVLHLRGFISNILWLSGGIFTRKKMDSLGPDRDTVSLGYFQPMFGKLRIRPFCIPTNIVIEGVVKIADVLYPPTHHKPNTQLIPIMSFQFLQYRLTTPAPGTDRVGKFDDFDDSIF
jgi:hypothetical protein